MSGEPRYVRVSTRGRWHIVERTIESTGALATACGRIFPGIRIGGWEAASRVRVDERCLKCRERR